MQRKGDRNRNLCGRDQGRIKVAGNCGARSKNVKRGASEGWEDKQHTNKCHERVRIEVVGVGHSGWVNFSQMSYLQIVVKSKFVPPFPSSQWGLTEDNSFLLLSSSSTTLHGKRCVMNIKGFLVLLTHIGISLWFHRIKLLVGFFSILKCVCLFRNLIIFLQNLC